VGGGLGEGQRGGAGGGAEGKYRVEVFIV